MQQQEARQLVGCKVHFHSEKRFGLSSEYTAHTFKSREECVVDSRVKKLVSTFSDVNTFSEHIPSLHSSGHLQVKVMTIIC